MTALLFAALFGAVSVDAKLPAGNAIVEKIDGDTVYLHQDLRDSEQDWFYWKFRVTGAAGRTLGFRFTQTYAVGSRSAAVSTDRGKTWKWADDLQRAQEREPKTNDHPDLNGFSWKFGPKDDEVWFSQTIPYDPADWRAFLDRHAADRGRLFEEGVLCKSRQGRDIEYARFGRLDGNAPYRIFVTSRHHCGETAATYVIEGLIAQVFADDDLGVWFRENVEIRAVPFVDMDGVVDGDQGKCRKPHDHARDYSDTRTQIYPEVKAIMTMLREWNPTIVNDFHCPWLRGTWFEENNANEFIYQVGIFTPGAWGKQQSFGRIVERVQESGIGYRQADDYRPGQGWNGTANFTKGMPLVHWASGVFTNAAVITTFEIPFANQRFRTLYPVDFRGFGRDIALAYRACLLE